MANPAPSVDTSDEAIVPDYSGPCDKKTVTRSANDLQAIRPDDQFFWIVEETTRAISYPPQPR